MSDHPYREPGKTSPAPETMVTGAGDFLDKVVDRIARMPRSRYGAHRVALVAPQAFWNLAKFLNARIERGQLGESVKIYTAVGAAFIAVEPNAENDDILLEYHQEVP